VHVERGRHVPRPRAILDQTAIAAAFAPDGLHGVSAGEVARCARVAKPTLYARGRSKEAVFLECVEAEVERLVARLHAADRRTEGRAPHHRAEALALALLDHAVRRPAAFRLLHVTARHRRSGVAADVDRALGRIPDRIAAALRRDLPASRDDAARVRAAALALHGAAAALAGQVEDRPAAAGLIGRAVATALRPPALAPILSERSIELGVY
jgi:AcrR family transcriptional regulator